MRDTGYTVSEVKLPNSTTSSQKLCERSEGDHKFSLLKYHLGRVMVTMGMEMTSFGSWEQNDIAVGNPRSKYGPSVTPTGRKVKCSHRNNVR